VEVEAGEVDGDAAKAEYTGDVEADADAEVEAGAVEKGSSAAASRAAQWDAVRREPAPRVARARDCQRM
jgi:hypothetical protein